MNFLYDDKRGEWTNGDGSLNAQGFKFYRSITKIVGLAITYGGSEWTVSRNMGETVPQAKVRVDNFLLRLPTFRQYMNIAKAKVLQTGMVYSIFGRRRDVRKYSHPTGTDYKQNRKDQGYAQRTALNHPIQSSAGDILKIVTNRVSRMIRESGCEPAGRTQAADETSTSHNTPRRETSHFPISPR